MADRSDAWQYRTHHPLTGQYVLRGIDWHPDERGWYPLSGDFTARSHAPTLRVFRHVVTQHNIAPPWTMGLPCLQYDGDDARDNLRTLIASEVAAPLLLTLGITTSLAFVRLLLRFVTAHAGREDSSSCMSVPACRDSRGGLRRRQGLPTKLTRPSGLLCSAMSAQGEATLMK